MNCLHRNTLHTDVEPVCKDCETFLVSGELPYSNPGWQLLATLFSAFEQGKITEDTALEIMENLGYSFTSSTPEQTKNPSY